jgi:tetraacyldisaccharide 4'-kinase
MVMILHWIYKGITSFRNLLFDRGILREQRGAVPCIGVGNLTVGGTGKTPMVQYLIQHLSDRKLGVISRGYGRKTRGFLEILPESTPDQVGDEPLMLAQNNPEIHFFVSEDRVNGLLKAAEKYPQLDTFVFDDVYQHRYLKPDFLILLSDFSRPFYKDHVLPYGRLREKRSGAERADAVVVTKCPDHLSVDERENIVKDIRKYSSAPVFFARYVPQKPLNSKYQGLPFRQKVILLSALADNERFQEQQSRDFEIIKHYAFKDHYKIPREKLLHILASHPDTPIVCTEKDMVKIAADLQDEDKHRFYVPVIGVYLDESFGNYLRTHLGFA